MAKQKYKVRLISTGTDAERQKVMDETMKYLIDVMAEIVVAKHPRPSERGAKYSKSHGPTAKAVDLRENPQPLP